MLLSYVFITSLGDVRYMYFKVCLSRHSFYILLILKSVQTLSVYNLTSTPSISSQGRGRLPC